MIESNTNQASNDYNAMATIMSIKASRLYQVALQDDGCLRRSGSASAVLFLLGAEFLQCLYGADLIMC